MSRLTFVVAALLLFAGAAQAQPGRFFAQCDVDGCYARCLEFALDSFAGLGLETKDLFNGASLRELAEMDISEHPSYVDFTDEATFVRVLRSCQEGCKAYTVEPASCDMRCGAYQQQLILDDFAVGGDPVAWLNNTLRSFNLNGVNETLLGAVDFNALFSAIDDANSGRAMFNITDLFPVLAALDLSLSLGDIVSSAVTYVSSQGRLDTICSTGCHFQQVACAACASSGRALCSCSDFGCKNCDAGVCNKCYGPYTMLSTGYCYDPNKLYKLSGEGDERGVGDEGVGGNDPFTEVGQQSNKEVIDEPQSNDDIKKEKRFKKKQKKAEKKAARKAKKAAKKAKKAQEQQEVENDRRRRRRRRRRGKK